MKAIKGDWVQIQDIVLDTNNRAPQVPEDTRDVPLEIWVKGFAQSNGFIGEEIKIKTITGRLTQGKLVAINPTYTHSFGNFIPELLQIGLQLKEILAGGEQDE